MVTVEMNRAAEVWPGIGQAGKGMQDRGEQCTGRNTSQQHLHRILIRWHLDVDFMPNLAIARH
jgi:hypothetical protein